MSGVTVVYLAREKSGFAACERFLRSYRELPAGMGHELLVIFKGFKSDPLKSEWGRSLEEFKPRIIRINDVGFDLRAYGAAAMACATPYLVLLNSFSELLAGDWLAKMYDAVRAPGIGLAGATGSWESMYSNAIEDCQSVRLPKRFLCRLRATSCKVFFPPFPNPHLRTNAFIISREVIGKVWPAPILLKRSAYLFENGKRSMLRRVAEAGLKTVVVDKHGRAHESSAWPESLTFRQGAQENLLVADNQTRLYSEADTGLRKLLSRRAWGPRAQTM